MKKMFLYLSLVVLFSKCSTVQEKNNNHVKDGFYEVDKRGVDSTQFGELNGNEILITYNSIYNEQEYTKVLIDTSDFVPLELETIPVTQKDSSQKSQLSITLSTTALGKLKTFTGQRLMKTVAIVLDGEAITMHKIKDTITGGTMVISWCGENACQRLYGRIKDNVKK
ncbi:MAG TPA: hypothetical protein VNX68_15170 [Nitrosopumilaceae archaeon]|nr:hypothetical protein [Nitrosopumilaceae archaeon]